MDTTRSTRTALRVEEVCEEDVFDRLRQAWNGLATRVSRSVFLRHEWFSAAWAWRHTDAFLWILCVYAAEKLVGVLPLMRSAPSSQDGRLLEFLIVPDTQSCDLLIEPDRADEVCDALVGHLMDRSPDWDELRLERLPPHSIVEMWLKPLLLTRGLHCRFQAVDSNPYVHLEDAWEDYYFTRSRNLKKSFNLARNRLARTGNFELERVSSNHIEWQLMQGFLNEAVSISARSWKRTTGNALDRPGPLAFIQRLTGHAYAHDWLCLWLLRIDGRAVAMEYQLVYQKIVYALRGDFDDEYKHLSPGSYVSRRLLEELFADGLKRYYMGPGNNAYKKRWSDVGDSLHAFVAYSPTIRGRAIALLTHDFKAGLRRLRDRVMTLVAAYAWLESTGLGFSPLLTWA